MPYVKPARRTELAPPPFYGQPPAPMEGPGDLAFRLANVLADYLRQRGESWQTINDVLGALDGVARDFWGQVGAPYEAGKRAVNGAIY